MRGNLEFSPSPNPLPLKGGGNIVTICVQNRECLFGEIKNGEMRFNDAGRMVKKIWEEIPKYYGINLDEFIIMPNHIHGIIGLVGATPRGCPNNGQAQGPAPTFSLFDIVHQFKSFTTNRYSHNVKYNQWPSFTKRLWQRNYYEHIIRNEIDLNQIRKYINDNPLKWELDEYYP